MLMNFLEILRVFYKILVLFPKYHQQELSNHERVRKLWTLFRGSSAAHPRLIRGSSAALFLKFSIKINLKHFKDSTTTKNQSGLGKLTKLNKIVSYFVKIFRSFRI